MPLIKGACVPPICFRRTLVGRWAGLQRNEIVGGVSSVTPIGANEWPNPDMLNKGLVRLGAERIQDCDGCICFTLRRWNPPLQIKIPPFTVEENSETDKNGVLTVNKYEVVGAVYLLHSVGYCMAPGTEVKIGDKWVPVEEAVKLKAGGTSSEEEKPEKKKKHPSKPKGKGGKRVAKKKVRG